MKKILAIMVLVGILSSCKKTPVNKGAISEDESKPFVEPKISLLSPTLTDVDPTAPQGSSTYNLLGYGYDLTGKFADASAVRSHVIDVDLFATSNSSRIVIDPSTLSSLRTTHAENAEDFSKQLSSQIKESNGLKLFKPSLTTLFPETDALSGKYVYGNYVRIIQHRTVRMMQSYSDLKDYLTPEFKQDVQSLNAEALVKKYGTHILSGISLGAKVSVTYQAETSSLNRVAAETAGFSYAMEKVFKLSIGSLDPLNTIEWKTISSPKLAFNIIGGDSKQLKESTTTVDITAWHLSATAPTAKFINILENGLMPLFELISEGQKKEAVKTYIQSYILNEQVKLTK